MTHPDDANAAAGVPANEIARLEAAKAQVEQRKAALDDYLLHTEKYLHFSHSNFGALMAGVCDAQNVYSAALEAEVARLQAALAEREPVGDDWTLNTEQMFWMLQNNNLILEGVAGNAPDEATEVVRELAATAEFKALFGDMGFDGAFDRYETMLEEGAEQTELARLQAASAQQEAALEAAVAIAHNAEQESMNLSAVLEAVDDQLSTPITKESFCLARSLAAMLYDEIMEFIELDDDELEQSREWIRKRASEYAAYRQNAWNSGHAALSYDLWFDEWHSAQRIEAARP